MPSTSNTPNILPIAVDQMRYPRFQDAGGMAPDLKDVLGFQPLKPDHNYAQYFPGPSRLRKNAVMPRQRILDTLDQSGLAQNTLVVFLSDHGEYGAAHGGMIEKWHTAYEEILHVPFLVSAPWVNTDQDQIRYVDQLTSHIDVLPTLLGLAGIHPAQVSAQIPNQTVEDLPGANLSAVIADPSIPVTPANGEARTGVLFISDDTITELLKGEKAPPGYKVFLGEVESLRQNGLGLSPGPVMQPCHLRCARTTEFKLVRYFDPENEAPDQWELYDLRFDPVEQFNLVTWTGTGEPVACAERLPVESALTAAGLDEVLGDMRKLLNELEQQYLGYPHPVVEGYVMERAMGVLTGSGGVLAGICGDGGC